MSREVRRVPLDWKHPTEPNPHWLSQAAWSMREYGVLSKLHMPQERFVGLMDDYPGTVSDWEQKGIDIQARRGHSWTLNVEYHLTGYKGRSDDESMVHPFYVFSEDGQTEQSIPVRDEDHLHELMLQRHAEEKPDPADYMPVWPGGTVLGWCLYETVSEGKPITPVFGSPEELVDHLATSGDDWKQQPWRRESAEALVRSGSSMGTFVAVGGVLYDGAQDLDKIPH